MTGPTMAVRQTTTSKVTSIELLKLKASEWYLFALWLNKIRLSLVSLSMFALKLFYDSLKNLCIR